LPALVKGVEGKLGAEKVSLTGKLNDVKEEANSDKQPKMP
jgi:hypothetical protein